MAETCLSYYHFQRFDLLIHMHETAADNIRLKTSLKISLRCVVNPAGCLHYCACGFKHVSPTIVPSPNFHEGWNMLKTSSIANECSPICAASLESWGVKSFPSSKCPDSREISRDASRDAKYKEATYQQTNHWEDIRNHQQFISLRKHASRQIFGILLIGALAPWPSAVVDSCVAAHM